MEEEGRGKVEEERKRKKNGRSGGEYRDRLCFLYYLEAEEKKRREENERRRKEEEEARKKKEEEVKRKKEEELHELLSRGGTPTLFRFTDVLSFLFIVSPTSFCFRFPICCYYVLRSPFHLIFPPLHLILLLSSSSPPPPPPPFLLPPHFLFPFL